MTFAHPVRIPPLPSDGVPLARISRGKLVYRSGVSVIDRKETRPNPMPGKRERPRIESADSIRGQCSGNAGG